MRQTFKGIYKGPEVAYAVLDFSGRGYIFAEDILNNMVMDSLRTQHLINKDDVLNMFAVGNMFPARVDTIIGDEKIPSGAISFDMFKKMFFP